MHRGALTRFTAYSAARSRQCRFASSSEASTAANARPPQPAGRPIPPPSGSNSSSSSNSTQAKRKGQPHILRQDKRVRSSEQLKPLMKMVEKMVGSPKAKQPVLPSRRGEEMSLKRELKMGEKSATIMSNEHAAFEGQSLDEAAATDEDLGYVPDAPIGSFVELRRSDAAQNGIVIGSGFIARKWRLNVLTRDGEAWIATKDDIFFSIPSMCPADVAIRGGSQAIAEDEKQVHARIDMLKRLRDFDREVEQAKIRLAKFVGSIYNSTRAKNPTEWAEISTSEIAHICTPNPTAAELVAVHKLLMHDSEHFIVSNTYQVTQTFRVRPLAEVEDIMSVRTMIREHDPAFDAFCSKAKSILRTQRKSSERSLGEGPSLVPAEHKWTDTDKKFIRFMVASLRAGRIVQKDPYAVSLSAIVKRIKNERFLSQIDNSTHQLLVDIGVMTPWQELVILDRINNIDFSEPRHIVNEREQGILRALENSRNQIPMSPEDFYLSDPLESIRHDFGNLPVYVIDDIFAEELDDGISLERIPSEPGNVWVHVHIADPASVIPHTHVLAKKAAEQVETCYFLQQSYPLFPNSLTHHPTHGLSLGTRSRTGKPDRVLTFSVKLDPSGNILDHTVRAGLIRNVKFLDYDSIDTALGLPPLEQYFPFGNGTKLPPAPSYSKEVMDDLRMFHEIAAVQRGHRVKKNWFALDRVIGSISMSKGREPEDLRDLIEAPRYHRGFPEMTYSTGRWSEVSEKGTRATIAEMMKLACRTASRFCLEKNIPVLRRAANPLIPQSEEAIQLLLDSRNELGFIDEKFALKYLIYQPPAQYTTHPAMHFGLGVPDGEGYVRVTSPLRRYGDMVVHWQIHHALLADKKLTKGLRFDKQWMEDFAIQLVMKERGLKIAQRRHNRFWQLCYIRRWQETFKDGKNQHLLPKDLPEEYEGDPLRNVTGYMVNTVVMNTITKGLQVPVHVPRFGLKEIVVDLPKHITNEAYLGMEIPMKIQDIYLGVKPVMVFQYDESRGQ